MKCPKCDYLGFDTGDRCRNCGYDFALLANSRTAAPADLPLHEREASPAGPNDWLEQLQREPELTRVSPVPSASSDPLAALPLDTVVARPAAPASAARSAPDAARASARAATASLPLFHPRADEDDQPLVKLPASPRAPLSVRRTPEAPRLRQVSRPTRPVEAAPGLQFADDPVPESPARRSEPGRPATRQAAARIEACGAARRLVAAGIDQVILLAIDAAVVYFTLKMAALTLDEWAALPLLPLLAFLGMMKAAYFCAFTLVGGQTIGKMAARIQVVSDDTSALDPPRAIQRTIAGALSVLTLGLAFAPVLLSPDRRALHDRVARTRVIALPS